jgi:hypothetical protein
MSATPLQNLKKTIKSKKFLIVHYSCSSLRRFPVEIGSIGCYDGNANIHEKKFSRNSASETEMIAQFLEYFRGKLDENYAIIGWNFHREIYGLQPILERYKTLTGKTFKTNLSKIKAYDLDELIKSSTEYAAFSGGLHNIALYNGMTMSEFIFGKDELSCLEEEKFQPLDNSVMRKIAIMHHVLRLIDSNNLIVKPNFSRSMYAQIFVATKGIRIFFHNHRIEIWIAVVTTTLGILIEKLIRWLISH